MPRLNDSQKDELLAIYEEAEAAGDTQSMTAVRDALAADRVSTGPGPIERIKTQAKAASRGFSGVLQAPVALGEGVGDLLLDVAETAAGGVEYLAPRFGMQQSLGLKKFIQDHSERYTERVQERRAGAEARAPGSVAVSDVVAGLAPVSAAKLRLGAKTLKGALAVGSAEGAVAANIPFEADGDRTLRTMLGASFAPFLGSISALKGAVMNTLTRIGIRRADSESQRLIEEAKAAFVDPNTGQALRGADDYTVAQQAGDPRLSRLAQQASDIKARDVVRDQLDARVANVREVARNLGGAAGIAQSPARAKALYKVVDETDRDMSRANSEFFENGVNRLLASEEGQAMRIPLKSVTDEITALEQDMGDLLGHISKSSTGAQLSHAITDLKTMLRGNVRDLKLAGVVKLQKSLNAGRLYGQAVLSPEEAAANRIRMQLQGALRRAVDDGPDEAGYNQLRAIQSEYAERSDLRRRLGDDALTQLFGDKSVLADPEKAFDLFINKNPEAQRMGVALLSHRSPETLLYFRQRYLDRILDDATKAPTAAMQSTLDVNKLYDGLTSKQLTDSPLFNARERAWAAASAKDLRVIMNSSPDVTRVGTEITAHDLAINLVSLTPAFMARLTARAVTGFGFENVLFTRQGREAMTTISNVRTASAAAKQRAAAFMIGLIAREDEAHKNVQQPQQ